MLIFSEILHKFFPIIAFPSINNSSLELLSSSYNNNSIYFSSIQLIYLTYFLNFSNNKENKKKLNKFDILQKIILNNEYLDIRDKNFFLKNFSSAQRCYSNFRMLGRIYKFKKTKKYDIDTDLCYVNFNKLRSSITIHLIEDNINYKFRLSDLVNIINKSLLNSPYFFIEPISIKNPFTNKNFSLSNLYNIYFKLKDSNYIMPWLFHLFFISNFDLKIFKENNESYIRDKVIESFCLNGTINEKYEYILKMFYSHYTSVNFTIHPQFPKKKLVNIFNKLLKYYLMEEYSLNPSIKEKYKYEIDYHLNLFSRYNVNFGKKILIKKKINDKEIFYYSFNEYIIQSSDLIVISRGDENVNSLINNFLNENSYSESIYDNQENTYLVQNSQPNNFNLEEVERNQLEVSNNNNSIDVRENLVNINSNGSTISNNRNLTSRRNIYTRPILTAQTNNLETFLGNNEIDLTNNRRNQRRPNRRNNNNQVI